MINRETFDISADNTIFILFVGSNDLLLFNTKAKDIVIKLKDAILFLYDTMEAKRTNKDKKDSLKQYKFFLPYLSEYTKLVYVANRGYV
jgi:hypothetical protein